MKYEDLTGKIIKCAMNVHTDLGSGFQEVVYQRALAIELTESHMNFNRECEMDLFYKNQKIGNRRVDFFVEKTIMLEIKAVALLENTHLAQAKNYLEASGLDVGLLINFGGQKLEFKRVFKQRSHPVHPLILQIA